MAELNKPRDDLSIEYLEECFTANFEEGVLFWNKRPLHHFRNERVWKIWNTKYSGTKAGNIYTRKSGYKSYQVGIQDISYLVHRIMFALYYKRWPKFDIGHKNGNSLDNRIENLEDIPHSDNMKFLKLKKQNKSGVNGVYWSNTRNCWVISTIRSTKIKPYLTQSLDFFEIVCARKSYEIAYGMHENHGKKLDS